MSKNKEYSRTIEYHELNGYHEITLSYEDLEIKEINKVQQKG